MIGKFIRSVHHFERLCNGTDPIQIIGLRHNNLIYGEVFKGYDRQGKTIWFFFQNVSNNIDYRTIRDYCNNETYARIEPHLSKFSRCSVLFHSRELYGYGKQFIVLPSDFSEQYDAFIKQNKKALLHVFNKYMSEEADLMKGLFAICKSANFVSWAIKAILQNRISFMTIYRIMVWNETYSQLVSKLSKKTITAYGNYNEMLKLLAECQNLRKVKRANDIINTFNTTQKKLLKDNFDNIPINLLNKFAVLSQTKQQNFIRKVSTIEDIDEIIRLLSFTVSEHFVWNKKSLIDFINNVEGLKCSIKFESDTSVLVKVEDFDTIKKLAKTTNWCISKNKSYWNNYINNHKDATQYVLFDFSKKEDDELSIVGFTTANNKGITHAHSFTNVSLMENPREFVLRNENFYQNIVPSSNDGVYGIYSVIANNNIPLSLITDFKSRFPIWNKSRIREQIKECFSDSEVKIYSEEDSKMVIATSSLQGIQKFLGEQCIKKVYEIDEFVECIIFFDFSKDANDIEKLCFSLVLKKNSYSQTANTIFNEYATKTSNKFNSIINDYNLPYNIICRPNTITNRFIEAINNHNINEIEYCLKNEEIKGHLLSKYNNKIKMLLQNELYSSLTNSNSLDLVNLLKKYDIAFENILSWDNIQNALWIFYQRLTTIYGSRLYNSKNFDKKVLFDKLLTNNLDNLNNNQKGYIGICYLIEILLEPFKDNEKALEFFTKKIGNNFNSLPNGGYITTVFAKKILSLALKNNNINVISNICSFALNNDMKEVFEMLLDIEITNNVIQRLILSFSPSLYKKLFNKKWNIKEEEPKVVESNYSTYKTINYSSIGSNIFDYVNVTNTYFTDNN